MSEGTRIVTLMGVFALFGCIQFGCEQQAVKKTEAVTIKQAGEKEVQAKPEEVARVETPAPRPVKKEEMASHPKDKRTIQQIISEITGCHCQKHHPLNTLLCLLSQTQQQK